MSEYNSKYVKCPYYIESGNTYQIKANQIRCEGIIKDTTTTVAFKCKSQEQRYRETHCYDIDGCKRCRIHQMLDAKWGVSDG